MRDFATKRARVPQSLPQGKKANSQSKPKKSRISSWVWLLLGLLLGVLLACVVVNHKMLQAKLFAHHQSKMPVALKKPKPKKSANIKPQFDFYHILPNEGSGISVLKISKPMVSEPKIFVIQVASYPRQNQAESMRAKLLLMGFNPKIDLTSSGWYRVDVGPVNSMRAGDVLRHKLQNSGIQGAMIRQVSQ